MLSNSTITRKKKLCRGKCGEMKYIYARGLCIDCDRIENPVKHGIHPKWSNTTTLKPKKRKRIPNFSNKLLKRMAIYRPLRDKHLEDNPICEVHDCNKESTNLHHINGRQGEMLIKTEFFLACCGDCHPNRIHFTETAWAIRHGYLKGIEK